MALLEQDQNIQRPLFSASHATSTAPWKDLLGRIAEKVDAAALCDDLETLCRAHNVTESVRLRSMLLCAAISSAHASLVTYLTSGGRQRLYIAPHARDTWVELAAGVPRPLHTAVRTRSVSMVTTLLHLGFDVHLLEVIDARERSAQKTAMDVCVRLGDVTVMKCLLPYWSSSRDHMRRTPLLIALRVARADACVKHLVERLEGGEGGELHAHAADMDGGTALIHAVPHGTALVQRLLRLGADITARNSAGRSALGAAIDRHDPDVVRALVAAGADLGGADWDAVRDALGRTRYEHFGRYHHGKYINALHVSRALIPAVFRTERHANATFAMVTGLVLSINQFSPATDLVYDVMHTFLCALNRAGSGSTGMDLHNKYELMRVAYRTLLRDVEHFLSLGDARVLRLVRLIVLHATVQPSFASYHYQSAVENMAPSISDIGDDLSVKVFRILMAPLPVPVFWECKAQLSEAQEADSIPGLKVRHLQARGYMNLLHEHAWPRLALLARRTILRNLNPYVCPYTSVPCLPLPVSLHDYILAL